MKRTKTYPGDSVLLQSPYSKEAGDDNQQRIWQHADRTVDSDWASRQSHGLAHSGAQRAYFFTESHLQVPFGAEGNKQQTAHNFRGQYVNETDFSPQMPLNQNNFKYSASVSGTDPRHSFHQSYSPSFHHSGAANQNCVGEQGNLFSSSPRLFHGLEEESTSFRSISVGNLHNASAKEHADNHEDGHLQRTGEGGKHASSPLQAGVQADVSRYSFHSDNDDMMEGVENMEDFHDGEEIRVRSKSFCATDGIELRRQEARRMSTRGSVTSERSSRLDPNTYQSYAAGILYSSGRSEKFLKLQRHFAVLERIGELDKVLEKPAETICISQGKGLDRHLLPTQEFQSKEELQELHSELEEARKNKEFFHEADKGAKFQWNPDKDIGLQRKESSLKELVSVYLNQADGDTDGYARRHEVPGRKTEEITRSLSFGELCGKYGGFVRTCQTEQEYKPGSCDNIKSLGKDDVKSVDKDNMKGVGREIHLGKDTEGNSTSFHKPFLSATIFGHQHKPVGSDNLKNAVKDIPFSAESASSSTLGKESLKESKGKDSSIKERKEYNTCGAHEASYLELLDNASKKPQQRALYGTHIDPPRNKYEVHVEEVRRICKEPDNSTLHIRSTSAPQSAYKNPALGIMKRSESHKESFFGFIEEDKTLGCALPGPTGIEQSLKKNMEIEVDGSNNPASVLMVKTDQDLKKMETGSELKNAPRPLARKLMKMKPNIIETNEGGNSFHGMGRKEKASFFLVQKVGDEGKHTHTIFHASPFLNGQDVPGIPQDKRDFQNTAGLCQNNLTTPGLAAHDHNDLPEKKGQFLQSGPSTLDLPSPSVTCSIKTSPNTSTRFLVKDLRSLVSDNEFTANTPAWMKKSSSETKTASSLIPSQSKLGPPRASLNECETTAGRIQLTDRKLYHESVGHKGERWSPSYQHTDKIPPSILEHKTSLNVKQGLNVSPVQYQNTPKLEAKTWAGENQDHSQLRGDSAKQTGEDQGGRRVGDGHHHSQYELNKCNALLDFHENTAPVYSPLKQGKGWPVENNASFSSTDTFIVRETDDEDMESSGASVSRLREIFGHKTISKSKSEPELASEENQPTRPRSAKSQMDLSTLEIDYDERESFQKTVSMPRTVSGEMRQQCVGTSIPDWQRDTLSEQPLEIAKAWVAYSDRSTRYEPYLPSEDILKEVAVVSEGRKLDVPVKKNRSPSNVSKMTLEYFDQIGSEWQKSRAKCSLQQHNNVSLQQSDVKMKTGDVRQPVQASWRKPFYPPYGSAGDVEADACSSMEHYGRRLPETDDMKLRHNPVPSFAEALSPQCYRHQKMNFLPLLDMKNNGSPFDSQSQTSSHSLGFSPDNSAAPEKEQIEESSPTAIAVVHGTQRQIASTRKSGFWNQERIPELDSLPPAPSRPPPVPPLPRQPEKTVQHHHSLSSFSSSELGSDGEVGGGYCVTTASYLYGPEAGGGN